MNLCAICQKRKPMGTAWLCSECTQEWELVDVPFKDWPDWVKALKDCEQQMRRSYAAEVSC